MINRIHRATKEAVGNIKELQQQLLGLQRGTEEYNEVAKKLAIAQDQANYKLGQTGLVLMSMGTFMEKALEGATRSFEKLHEAQMSLLKSMPEVAGGISELTDYVTKLGIQFGESASTMLSGLSRMGGYGVKTGEAIGSMGDAFIMSMTGAMSYEQAMEYLGRMMGEFNTSSGKSMELLNSLRHTGMTASRSMELLNTVMSRIYSSDNIGLIEGLGVATKDQNGNYRDMYDIMKDLAEKWKDLDETTQGYMASQIGSTRNTAYLNQFLKDFGSSTALSKDEVLNLAMAMGTGAWHMEQLRLRGEVASTTIGEKMVFAQNNMNASLLSLTESLGAAGGALGGFLGTMMATIPQGLQLAGSMLFLTSSLKGVSTTTKAGVTAMGLFLPMLFSTSGASRVAAGGAFALSAALMLVNIAQSSKHWVEAIAAIGIATGAIVAVYGLAEMMQGLQKGGIVPGNMGEPRLILAHGQEQIIPTGRPTKTGNLTIINNFYGSITKEDSDAISNKLYSELRRKGVI